LKQVSGNFSMIMKGRTRKRTKRKRRKSQGKNEILSDSKISKYNKKMQRMLGQKERDEDEE
jgi:hypothetical protein